MNSPIKWHGGKHYLASRIVTLMPPHIHYVEPYAGSLAVLLAKNPEGVSEVANDLHGGLANFWTVIREPHFFHEFQRRIQATPFGEPLWNEAARLIEQNGLQQPGTNPVLNACCFFIHCRQSLAGRMDTFAPLSKNRTRRGMNEQAAAWLSAIEGLPQVHARLARVVILRSPALDVIQQQDGPNTLFYLDPPYTHDTRTALDAYGEFEMTPAQHLDLCVAIRHCKGKVMLSGYNNQIYRDLLDSWNRHDFELPNNAASGDTKRRMVESVWCNF